MGFDDFQKCFIVRNSWGEDRGDKGYFCSLTSTFAIHNWHETLGPSTGSKISRRLRQRESKSQSFFVVVPGGVKTYLHHAEHQHFQTRTSGECVRYVGLTPPSCVEKAGVACFVFQVAMAVWLGCKRCPNLNP